MTPRRTRPHISGKRDPVTHRTPEQIQKMADGYNKTPKARHAKKLRDAARGKAIKEGRVKVGDGKDIDHKRPIRSGGGNSPGNTRVVSASKNRGWRRGGRKT